MSSDIDRYIEELRHALMVATLNYDIWRAYTSENCRPTYVETMNRYKPFFQTSLNAHFGALVITLYRLYDKRPGTISIPSLLRILREQKRLADATLDSLDQMYKEAKPLWIKVASVRSKVFAHRFYEQTVDEVFKEAGITPNQLRDLVEVTKKLLNDLTQAWDKSTHAFNLGSREATLWLLKDLKDALAEKKAKEEQRWRYGRRSESDGPP